MNIDPSTFDNGPAQTDSGVDIACHANHGDGCPIIEIASIPHDKIEHIPACYVDGVRFVFHEIDEYSGNLVFRQADYVDELASEKDPVTGKYPGETDSQAECREQQEFDAAHACDIDGVTD